MKPLFKAAAFGGAAYCIYAIGFESDALAQQATNFWGNPTRRGYHAPNLAPARFAIIAGSGFLGFGLGWFLSPQAAAFRRIIASCLLAVLLLLVLLNNDTLGWGITSLVALIAFMVGFGFWTRGVVSKLKERPTSFGSAAWASLTEMFDFGLIGQDGFHLGLVDGEDGEALTLRYAGDRHLLTIAPTRAWKGISAIIPNLMTYEGSVVVIDPKGENSMITAKHRASLGQTVCNVDPWAITGMQSARFNPMDWLKAGDIDINENAMLLADAMIVAMGENEQFWTEEAKALLLGVILFVATDPQEDGQRHLGRVRDLLLLDGDDLNALFKRMLQSPHHTVRSTGTQRQLAYADELMRMPLDQQLLLVENMNPVLATKQPWFKNPSLKDLGVNLHKKQKDAEAAEAKAAETPKS